MAHYMNSNWVQQFSSEIAFLLTSLEHHSDPDLQQLGAAGQCLDSVAKIPRDGALLVVRCSVQLGAAEEHSFVH